VTTKPAPLVFDFDLDTLLFVALLCSSELLVSDEVVLFDWFT
jgi:hypothetical protein